ncbi:MAG: DUF1572 family protein [Calditrichae bacterium]|nr:DUF1572 family protein [Calditrichia bacterium]
MDGKIWLDQIIVQFRKYKIYSERAAEQVADDDFFSSMGGNPQSVATLMKHVGGNHRSRWRDFLTTDGEKSDRNRESEFSVDGETRQSIYQKWEDGWQIAFDSLEKLTAADLEKTITIRGEPMGVTDAIQRNLNHVAYHTGQIVHLARQLVGEKWQTLSIAVGKSDEFNRKMQSKFGDWWSKEKQ